MSRTKSKTRKKSITKKKSKQRTTTAKTLNQGGKLRITCPIHNGEEIHRLGFNEAIVTKKSKKNKRGMIGTRVSTQWFYCKKCDKPRKITFLIAN